MAACPAVLVSWCPAARLSPRHGTAVCCLPACLPLTNCSSPPPVPARVARCACAATRPQPTHTDLIYSLQPLRMRADFKRENLNKYYVRKIIPLFLFEGKHVWCCKDGGKCGSCHQSPIQRKINKVFVFQLKTWSETRILCLPPSKAARSQSSVVDSTEPRLRLLRIKQ